MPELRIGVLGPIQVERGSIVVRLGPQLKTLLSALVVQVGRPVPADRLVQLLWGASGHESASATLRSHVAHLRRALHDRHDDGRRVLATVGRGPDLGYCLRLEPDQVDACRFEQTFASARRLLAAGEQSVTAQAVDLIRDALDLWRGPAYADVADRPFALAEISRLNALRRSARRSCAEALSTLGRLDEALEPVAQLVEDDPYDEGARRLHALALYAEQRIGDAAKVCHDGMMLLRERGIDSPGLHQLQRAILRRTAAVPMAAEKKSACSLPPDPAHFVGRIDTTRLARGLIGGPGGTGGPLIVSGPAGVGKTAFAIRFAHLMAERFPDGRLYVDLRGFHQDDALSQIDALRALLGALGTPPRSIPATGPEQEARYREIVAGKRLLVVLDNARDAKQVRPLLPGVEGCSVIVTSRSQMPSLVTADGATPVALGLLSDDESRQLLGRHLGAARIEAEPSAVDEIVALCGGLPLALAIVAARAANADFSLDALASQLRQPHTRIAGYTSPDPSADLPAVLSWSYRILPEGAARMFRLLGVHPGPEISAPAAASLADCPLPDARQMLAALAGTHLIEECSPSRYAMHDLIRGYAAELAESEPEEVRQPALRRTLDHYLTMAEAADRLICPEDVHSAMSAGPASPGDLPEPLAGRDDALAWFASEYAVLAALCHQAIGAGQDRCAYLLARSVGNYLGEHGHRDDWITIETVALSAAIRSSDDEAQADCHYRLGRAHARTRNHPDAETHYLRAFELFQSLGDCRGQANAQRGLGGLFHQQGMDEAASDHIEHALELYTRAGNTVGQAMALNNIGWLHAGRGDYPEALTHCRRALNLLRQVTNPKSEAATWDSLGHIYHRLAHHQEAMSCYRQAIKIYRQVGDRYNEGDSIRHLADVHHDRGDRVSTLRAWRHALNIFDSLGHPDAEEVRALLADGTP